VTSDVQEKVLEALGVHTTEQRVGETVSISLPRPAERHLLVGCLPADVPELLQQEFQAMVDAVEHQAGVKIHAVLGDIEATLSEREAVP
jgi:Flp pilus assembly protein TadB